ncbi:hypothetical protein LXL04_005264 [Taraxacum kok-saghyz]
MTVVGGLRAANGGKTTITTPTNQTLHKTYCGDDCRQNRTSGEVANGALLYADFQILHPQIDSFSPVRQSSLRLFGLPLLCDCATAEYRQWSILKSTLSLLISSTFDDNRVGTWKCVVSDLSHCPSPINRWY